MYVCIGFFCLRVHRCTICVPGDHRGQKKESDAQDLELQMVMSYHVAVGIHLWGTGPGIQGFVHTRQTHSHKETFLIWRWLLGRIVRGMEELWA